MSMSTSSTAETNLSVVYSVNSDYDELCQNYQNAVHCVVHCESIIKQLEVHLVSKDEELASKDQHIASLKDEIEHCMSRDQELLASKDHVIASLEEKIVHMSLEMASLKAFEDTHRSKRRVSENDMCTDNGSSRMPPTTRQATGRRVFGRAVSAPIHEDDIGCTFTQDVKENHAIDCRPTSCPAAVSISGSSKSNSSDTVSNSSFSTSSSRDSLMLDDSTPSSKRLPNIGQLFRKNRCGDSLWAGQVNDSKVHQVPTKLDESSASCRQEFGGLDNSFTNRIGQLFNKNRGFMREPNNDCSTADALPTMAAMVPLNDQPNLHDPLELHRRRPAAKRKSNPRSFSSTVMFPVTSEDIIKGLMKQSKDSKNMANAEWNF